MKRNNLDIAILPPAPGWPSRPAAGYEALAEELRRRDHRVALYERRFAPDPEAATAPSPEGSGSSYSNADDLFGRFGTTIAGADLVIVGSGVAEGVGLVDRIASTARGVLAFHDSDAAATVGSLRENRCPYLAPRQIPRFDLYLADAEVELLQILERAFDARAARPLRTADGDVRRGDDLERYYVETLLLGRLRPRTGAGLTAVPDFAEERARA